MSHRNGKVVAITGASSGIGAATAALLAGRGNAVVLGARRVERLDEIADAIREHGGSVLTCRTDVTRRDDVEQLVAQAVEEYGRLDVFVGNAGISNLSNVGDLDVQRWEAMFDVNVRGVMNGIAAALPVFRRQGSGHLVVTLSTAGLKINPSMAVYGATKNAARTILEGLRMESRDGVLRATAISPGYVRSELAQSIDDPQLRVEIQRNMDAFAISPDAVAQAIAFAIELPADVEISEVVIRPTVQG